MYGGKNKRARNYFSLYIIYHFEILAPNSRFVFSRSILFFREEYNIIYKQYRQVWLFVDENEENCEVIKTSFPTNNSCNGQVFLYASFLRIDKLAHNLLKEGR